MNVHKSTSPGRMIHLGNNGRSSCRKLQEHTRLPIPRKKKTWIRKIRQLRGKSITSLAFQPLGIINLLSLKSSIAFLSALRSSVEIYRSDLGWDRLFL